VEDAFDQALVVKSFFASAGNFDVTHAQDGDSAAQFLRGEEWDLFVTDLNLPGTDGFELIRICRELHPEVPVMATTGSRSSLSSTAIPSLFTQPVTATFVQPPFFSTVTTSAPAGREKSVVRSSAAAVRAFI